MYVGAWWASGLERRTGDRMALGSNPAGTTSLRNFGNSVYSTLPMSFQGDTKSCWSLLSGVYARGSKRSHTDGKRVTFREDNFLFYFLFVLLSTVICCMNVFYVDYSNLRLMFLWCNINYK